jgi:hypothetical protein
VALPVLSTAGHQPDLRILLQLPEGSLVIVFSFLNGDGIYLVTYFSFQLEKRD